MLHNDSLLALDEMGLVDPQEVGQIAYSIASGAEKERMNVRLNNNEVRTWRTLVPSSGELSVGQFMSLVKSKIKDGQSVRLIDIPAEVEGGFGCFETIHGHKDGEAFVKNLEAKCKK